MASTELTTSQNAAPPNNASNGTRKEVSTDPVGLTCWSAWRRGSAALP
jgi:hypothetical protein